MTTDSSTTLVGVISDTHGLLRPEAIDAMQGSALIIHAGDVGEPEILETLRSIAPVHVVRGNVDYAPWARILPMTELVEVDGVSIYVLHDLHKLALDPVASGIDMVITGHSHQPKITEQDGVIYLNPGSAGPRRFDYPVSVAHVEISGTNIVHHEIVTLEV